MKSRPILFSGPMIRAILSGQKTQTRRVIKQVPTFLHLGRPIMDWPLSDLYSDGERFWLDVQTDVDDNMHKEIRCPYGVPGDQLWVRETVSLRIGASHWKDCNAELRQERFVTNRFYRATHNFPVDDQKWIPAIHMPRWASRITLEITNVRVERLQDVTEEDAIAEGFNFQTLRNETISARCNFHFLWEEINAKRGYGWDKNPWVWVIEFKRIEK